MATTIRQTEAAAIYDDPSLVTDPDDPAFDGDAIGLFIRRLSLSSDARALSQDIVWSRIEAFVSHRWHSRTVVWLVEGAGDWEPPLEPATITSVEAWDGGNWTSVQLPASPFGGVSFPNRNCVYRVTANVGSGRLSELPADVIEAFRRIAEYLVSVPSTPLHFEECAVVQDVHGASQISIDVEHGENNRASFSLTQNPRFRARVLEFSGAGDLLRKYRKGR